MKLNIEQLENKRLCALCQDPEISLAYDNYYKDSNIDRGEMISILNISKDNGGVDKTEIKDLRRITRVSNMPEYVRILANDIIFPNIANKTGSVSAVFGINEVYPESNFTILVDKWFYGKDRPKTDYEYKQVNGTLFINGISSSDINQGYCGDCYLFASLSSLADKSPKLIRSMFISNEDNTWTVRFFKKNDNNYVADYITVDKFLPVFPDGSPVYERFGSNYLNRSNELWPALIEKAYAQWNETGNTERPDKTNSYDAISGGWSELASAHLSGFAFRTIWDIPNAKNFIISEINSKKPVVAYRFMNAEHTAAHAYYVKSYSNDIFTLINPWGFADVNLTWEEFKVECYGFVTIKSYPPIIIN